MSPPMSPPSKRYMQLEAWMVLTTAIVVSWCVVGGIWLGLKTLWALARAIFPH